MRYILLIFLSLTIYYNSVGQLFENITPSNGLGNGSFPNLVFGDIDRDGDQDLIIAAQNGTTIFFNDNGDFSRSQSYPEFIAEYQIFQNIDIGDVNLDGQLDILETGGPNYRVLNVLLNKNLTLTNLNQSFQGIAGAGSLGDFDSDGDLDIIYSGVDQGSNKVGGIYIYEDLSLKYSPNWFPNNPTRFAAWTDLNRDSKIDILQSSGVDYFIGNFRLNRIVARNYLESKPINISTPFIAASFADLDCDGDMDMLTKESSWKFRIYFNINGDFYYSGVEFPTGRSGLLADMNSDGFYDVVLAGVEETFSNFETRIYLNNGNNGFSKMINTGLSGSYLSSVAVADIDKDGDLDLALAGNDYTFQIAHNRIYKNNINSVGARQKPLPPANLSQIVSFTDVALSWSPGSDSETSGNCLTYNLHIRKEDGSIVMPSHSLPDGTRLITKTGNAYNNTTFNLTCLKEGKYYWSVQTLDSEYNGSMFSSENSFIIANTAPANPGNLKATNVTDQQVNLDWLDLSLYETSYLVSRRKSGNIFWQELSTLPSNSNRFVDTTNLEPNTEYEYRVIAYNCAYKSEYTSSVTNNTFPKAFQETNWLNLGPLSYPRQTLLGDIDNDGDLDLLASYQNSNYQSLTKLFKFTPNGYVDSGFELPFIDYNNSAQWIDINTDGYIDLSLNAEGFNGGLKPRIFINQKGNGFVEIFPNFSSGYQILWQGGVVWGDLDSDGDMDLLQQVTNGFGTSIQLKFFENKGNLIFSERTDFGFPVFIKSTEPLNDYDNDGDLDILVSRFISCASSPTLAILENEGGAFTLKNLNLPGLNNDIFNRSGDWRWADFNNDGFDDIVISGQETCSSGSGISKVYLNNKMKSFYESNIKLVREVYDVQIKTGDFDNDGHTDLFLYGNPGQFLPKTKVYKNVNGNLIDTKIDYLAECVQGGSIAIGDIDNDGDLDLVISGQITFGSRAIVVYKNVIGEQWEKLNTQPKKPETLQTTISNGNVQLNWSNSNDQETLSPSLSYQTYVLQDQDTIISSNSTHEGTRKIIAPGNQGHLNRQNINLLKPGKYTWSVQAIDAGLRGSSFSDEIAFILLPPPIAQNAVGIKHSSFIAKWLPVAGAESYSLDVSGDNFMSYLPGYQNKIISSVSDTIKGLMPNSKYYFRVKSLNKWGSSMSSNSITVITINPSVEAVEPTDITPFSFVARWKSLPGALNYSLEVSVDNFASLIPEYNGKVLNSLYDTVKSLFPSRTYQYRVRANLSTGPSLYSTVVPVTTIVIPTVEAIPGTSIFFNSFVANWNSIPSALSYSLDVSKDNFLSFVEGYKNKLLNSVSLSDTVKGLTVNTTYQYRIRANFRYGVSLNSNVITTKTKALDVPKAKEALRITENSFEAGWFEASVANSYLLDVSQDKFITYLDGYNQKKIIGLIEPIKNLKANTTYYYRVMATTPYGISEPSNTIEVSTLVTSLSSEQSELFFYPNPAENFLWIVSEADNFDVYDFLGKKLDIPIQKNEHVFEVDLSSLSNGIYFIKSKSLNRGRTFKFIKIN